MSLLRKSFLSQVFWFIVSLVAGCGVKGPPLSPLLVVPAATELMSVSRLGDRVYIEFQVPSLDTTGERLLDLERVDVYAVTTLPVAFQPIDTFSEDWLDAATLVSSVVVRRPGPQDNPGETDSRPLHGDVVSVMEVLAAGEFEPVAVTPVDDDEEEIVGLGPVVMPYIGYPSVRIPVRSYVAFGVSAGERFGLASEMMVVPLAESPKPPSRLDVTYSELSAEVTWEAPNTLRLSVQAEVVETEDPDGLLASTPVLPGGPPSQYVVYDQTKSDPEMTRKPEPLGVPIVTEAFIDSSIIFGSERCYVVRVLDAIDGVEVEGEASESTCVVFRDTFAPAMPTGLTVVAGEGSINLAWNQNGESDVRGYLVFRETEEDGTRQLLTPLPIEATVFRDTDVRPGEQYIYRLTVVDTAEPPNSSFPSDGVIETAR